MKRTMGILSLIFITALLVASGRPAEDKDKSDSDMLQGTWKGHELAGDTNGVVTMIITGKKFEFRGSDTNEWYKGTFTLKEDAKPRQMILVIDACASPEYVGKTSQAIYEFKEGTLTIAGNEPGNPNVPAGFDAPDARKVAFKKE